MHLLMRTNPSHADCGHQCVQSLKPLQQSSHFLKPASMFASDSSPYGYGICERKLGSDLVGSIGGLWRFRFEDAVDARKH